MIEKRDVRLNSFNKALELKYKNPEADIQEYVSKIIEDILTTSQTRFNDKKDQRVIKIKEEGNYEEKIELVIIQDGYIQAKSDNISNKKNDIAEKKLEIESEINSLKELRKANRAEEDVFVLLENDPVVFKKLENIKLRIEKLEENKSKLEYELNTLKVDKGKLEKDETYKDLQIQIKELDQLIEKEQEKEFSLSEEIKNKYEERIKNSIDGAVKKYYNCLNNVDVDSKLDFLGKITKYQQRLGGKLSETDINNENCRGDKIKLLGEIFLENKIDIEGLKITKDKSGVLSIFIPEHNKTIFVSNETTGKSFKYATLVVQGENDVLEDGAKGYKFFYRTESQWKQETLDVLVSDTQSVFDKFLFRENEEKEEDHRERHSCILDKVEIRNIFTKEFTIEEFNLEKFESIIDKYNKQKEGESNNKYKSRPRLKVTLGAYARLFKVPATFEYVKKAIFDETYKFNRNSTEMGYFNDCYNYLKINNKDLYDKLLENANKLTMINLKETLEECGIDLQLNTLCTKLGGLGGSSDKNYVFDLIKRMYYIRGNTDDIEDSLKKDRLCEIENTIQIFESEVGKKNIVKTRSLKNIKIVKEAKDYHWYNEVQIFLKTCQTINAANYSEDVEPLKLKLNYIIENNPSAFDELYNFFYRRADKKMAPIMNLVGLLEYLVKELTMFDVIDFAKVAEKGSRETITTKKELIVNIKANLEDYDFSEKKYKKEIGGILGKIGHKNLIRYEAILTFCKLCIFRFKIASMRELYSVVLQIPLK